MVEVITNISALQYTTDFVDNQPCVALPSVYDYVYPCFVIKHDCNNIFVEDKSDYTLPNNIIVELISIEHKSGVLSLQNCGTPVPVVLPLGSKRTYEALYGNGKYTFVWRITVVLIDEDTLEETTLVYEHTECVKLECCEEDICGLKDLIKSKITKLGCKINEYELMGRDTKKLYNALFALGNALFYISTSKEKNYCEDAALVNCFLNSIKSVC